MRKRQRQVRSCTKAHGNGAGGSSSATRAAGKRAASAPSPATAQKPKHKKAANGKAPAKKKVGDRLARTPALVCPVPPADAGARAVCVRLLRAQGGNDTMADATATNGTLANGAPAGAVPKSAAEQQLAAAEEAAGPACPPLQRGRSEQGSASRRR